MKNKPKPKSVTFLLDAESQKNLAVVEAAIEAMMPPGPARGRTSAAIRHALAVAARAVKK